MNKQNLLRRVLYGSVVVLALVGLLFITLSLHSTQQFCRNHKNCERRLERMCGELGGDGLRRFEFETDGSGCYGECLETPTAVIVVCPAGQPLVE